MTEPSDPWEDEGFGGENDWAGESVESDLEEDDLLEEEAPEDEQDDEPTDDEDEQ